MNNNDREYISFSNIIICFLQLWKKKAKDIKLINNKNLKL